MTAVPDDALAELASFRRQWQEEVKSKQQQQQQHQGQHQSQDIASGSTTKHAAQATLASNLPASASGSSANPTEPSDGDSQAPEKDNIENFHRKTVLDPVTALEHYERAVEEETHGSLGESLKFYRKAFKMDAQVDDLYKNKHFPKPKPSIGNATSSKAIDIPTPEPAVLLPTLKLIPNFSDAQILPAETSISKFESEPEFLPSPLTHLPHELLLQIFERVALLDVPTYGHFTQVCKAFCYLSYTEDRIWRDVCTQTFERMCWGPKWKCGLNGGDVEEQVLGDDELDELGNLSLEDRPAVVPTDEEVVVRYGDSWRRMFVERPRIRFNGIYISTCTYQRPGISNMAHVTFTTPIHIVTYYRYLRFYPNGFVLSLLTTTEPQDVVHILTLENYDQYRASLAATGRRRRQLEQRLHETPLSTTKDSPTTNTTTTINPTTSTDGTIPTSTLHSILKLVLPGRWQISPTNDGKVDIETDGPGGVNNRHTHEMQLFVKMRPKGLGGKGGDVLRWGGHWSFNRVTDDRAQFSLRNDKPFYFSRVKTYEREMGWA